MQINKIRDEKGDLTDTKDIQESLRTHFKILYSIILENLKKKKKEDNLLMYKYRPITPIYYFYLEAVIKSTKAKQTQKQD